MGSTPKMAQFLSAPPYLFASAVVLGTNYFSDRLHTRSPFLITHALLSSLAYLTIAATGSFHAHLPTTFHVTLRYLCLYPAAAGFFSSITLILAWTMDNRVEAEGKGASVAILNIIGQCGPLIGTRLYPESDGPWYVRGMFVCAMFMLLVAVLAVTLRVILLKENNKAASGDKADGGGDIELELVEREGLMPGRGASGRGRGSGSDSHLNRGSGDYGRLIYII